MLPRCGRMSAGHGNAPWITWKEPDMQLVSVVLVGLAAGALSVLLGVGGGVIIVPALMYFAGMEIKLATGTSLAVIIPTALMGAIGRAQLGQIDWRVAAIVSIGAIIGARLGTSLVEVAPAVVLKRGFAVLLLLTAVRMLLSAR